MESAVCAKYLKVLLDLGIIQKETPITENGGKKTIYAIDVFEQMCREYLLRYAEDLYK